MAPESVGRTQSRRADASSNAQRILESAYVLLSSGKDVSLEDVAAHAHVGIATLYRHFPNRAALTRAVLASAFEREVAPLLASVDLTAPGRESFVTFASRLLDLVDRERHLLASAVDLEGLTDDLIRQFAGPFGDILKQGQQVGEIRADLQPADIPPILTMLVGGLSNTGASASDRSRYLALFFDALRPGHREDLPPLVESDEVAGFRTSFAAIASTVRRTRDGGR